MKKIHFNEAVDLRITKIEEFVSGRRYLMVHNRFNGDKNHAPPFVSEVWATGWEFVSFNELDARGNNVLISDAPICVDPRHIFFYIPSKGGFRDIGTASDHGLTDTTATAHTMNYILDVEELSEQGIEILLEPSEGTDMENYPDPYADYYYNDVDIDTAQSGSLL